MVDDDSGEDDKDHPSDNASSDYEDELGHPSDNEEAEEPPSDDEGQEEEVDRLADIDAAAVRFLGLPRTGRKKYVLKTRKPRAIQGRREEATQATLVNCSVTLSWS